MTSVISKVSKLFFASFDQTALLSGISDILVIKWKNGTCVCTPFLACFGAHAIGTQVKVYINDMLINGVNFHLDKYGYVHPMLPSQEIFEKLHLHYGKNKICFESDNSNCLEAEIYLYSEEDKFLVSDLDGTMTKSDARGIFYNIKGKNYLHDGYYQLLEKIERNGYKIIWLTMRSLPLYKISKRYVRSQTKIDGILFTEPEEFFPAVKKQLMKKTGNIKTNMMRVIRNLFPQNSNPFIGGLGNRENDAIAYLAAGIQKNKIFIVDKKSEVHNLADSQKSISYQYVSEYLDFYFPKNPLSEIERTKYAKTSSRKNFMSIQRVHKKKKIKHKLYEDDIKQSKSTNQSEQSR